MEIKLTVSQMKCLTVLVNSPEGKQCCMGGGKRVHILNACRALVRKGLAIEYSNVYFIASKSGREEFKKMQYNT